MINGLYSAASAMAASARQHEVISQNLAHVQMPGYRRQSVHETSTEHGFDDHVKEAMSHHSMGTDSSKVVYDFSTGTLEQTGHPLDVALEGKGFFVIEGPNGPLYTRNGVFQIDSEGRLVTADLLPVASKGGDITFPPDVSPATIAIDKEGRISVKNVEIGQLAIVDFEEPQRLALHGVTLFEAPDDMPPKEIESNLVQGSRERSNVSPIQELVNLIAAQRRQEAAQKSMNLIQESVGKRINVQGGV